ncbi:MAG: T9SS type A sorting domain-containing protein [Bacteroidota bacterium]
MKRILLSTAFLFAAFIASSQIAPTSSPYNNNGTYGIAADSATVSGKKVVIYHPTGGVTGALYPVLIFQPGANGFFGGTITVHSYDLFMKHLCSWGYVVLVIDETAAGLPNGTTFKSVHDWFKTQTTTNGTLLKGCADPTKVVVGGHSNGGVNACALIDDRPTEVHGCVLFASYPSSTFPVTHDMSTFAGKVLDLAGADDATSSTTNCSTGYDAFTAAACKNWVLFTGMDHGAFGDYVNTSQPVGSIGRTNATASIRHYLVAFMEGEFKGDAVAKANLTQTLLQPNTTNEFLTTCPSSVNVEENNFSLECNLYPNPASSVLNIDFGSALNEDAVIKIYNVYGACILQQSIEKNTISGRINLSQNGISSGMYMIQIESGNQKVSKKLWVN